MNDERLLGSNLGSLFLLPFLVVLVALQSRFFAYLPVNDNVIIQILPIVTIAWALWRGGAAALVVGCVAGLLIDFNSIAPLGSSALPLVLAVCVLLPLRTLLIHSRLVAPVLLTLITLFVWLLVHHVVLILSGYDIGSAFGRLPATLAVHTVGVLLLYWLLRGFGRIIGRRQSDLAM